MLSPLEPHRRQIRDLPRLALHKRVSGGSDGYAPVIEPVGVLAAAAAGLMPGGVAYTAIRRAVTD